MTMPPALADYIYPIVWWGLLPVIDEWNRRRCGLSLWRGNFRHFLGVTAPVSVLVWVFYEALNLPAPQWGYRGGLPGVWPKVFFGFVAFSTVIPIMVESWWLVGGKQCLPAAVGSWFRNHRWLLIAAAAVFAVIPVFNDVFWFNQGIWIIPALVLLPWLRVEPCRTAHFIRTLVVSSLLAGLAWEALNYPARTHWEYLILPDLPHLFYMPAPGYIGFVPFGFSMLAAYEAQRRVAPTLVVVAVLYAAATAGLYILTVLYIDRGIWLSNS